MKNFLNGWGFSTGIPLIVFSVMYLIGIRKPHDVIADLILVMYGVAFLLRSSVLYLGTYLLSDLLVLNKQRQIFLPYATSILYWGLHWTFTFVVPVFDFIGFLDGKCLRFVQNNLVLSFFFSGLVWWVLSVCLAIIISRFTSDGFLQKTNRIFSKIGRCLCWIVVLFFLYFFALYLLGYLLSRNKPEI